MRTIFFSLLLISTLFFHTSAYAETAQVSRQQAVSIATQSYPGRVLAVKLQNRVYRIKILNEKGNVQIIKVDAADGKIVSGSQHRH